MRTFAGSYQTSHRDCYIGELGFGDGILLTS
jgi:hypothetical protein